MIEDNISILEYLKNKNFPFRLQQIDYETFAALENQEPIFLPYDHFIAGFSPFKGEKLRSSGGLKVSDPEKKIMGNFCIEETRIIYDAAIRFFEERDAVVYSGYTYYTTKSMVDILKEELQKNRKLLVYMGQEIDRENYKSIELLKEVSEEEFLLYASNPTKGEEILIRKRYF